MLRVVVSEVEPRLQSSDRLREAVPRYRFSEFTLSPRRRTLTREGVEQPLIPRYFDLLVFLIERRHEAVHRRDIFDRVWTDVVVSDSALSQAIRTIRRTLGDDSREPRFIRTVSRHGYQFVFGDVLEEGDDVPEGRPETMGRPEGRPLPPSPLPPSAPAPDPFESLLHIVTAVAASPEEEEAQRDAAEQLHALGTSEALQRLGTRPRYAFARALLRDTRWDSPRSGPVPILGAPAPMATGAALAALRLRRAARIAATRWVSASLGGGAAGLLAGIAGGVILVAAPGSTAPIPAIAVLAFIGLCAGAAGGAGVGAGLSLAESTFRSQRLIALTAGGAVGGAVVGGLVQSIGRASLEALVGLHVEMGGGVEGLIIGAVAGLSYATTTSRTHEGLAAPRGAQRATVAAVMAVACGLATSVLAVSGHALVGGTIHAIAHAAHGAQVELTPFGRLMGEPDFGPVSQTLIGSGEGAFFGLGLALGLTRRP
jgi:DNA-binding winged helix-turn-helix (wHTH) protein